MKCLRLTVSGRVQGVAFRAYAQREARALGLAGYVRNLPDEAVEIIVIGNDEQVDQLVEWAHQGPPAARVDHVQVTPIMPDAALRDFSIRY
ncbi:acylphosphatase [Candidatus Neomarinimicrobiota bacterium]